MSLLTELGDELRGAFEGVFGVGTLHVAIEAVDEYGRPSGSYADHECEGFISNWDAQTMVARGYNSKEAKILIMQSDDLPAPKLNDEVTMVRPLNETAKRYRITDVASDPADATWQVAGVLV